MLDARVDSLTHSLAQLYQKNPEATSEQIVKQLLEVRDLQFNETTAASELRGKKRKRKKRVDPAKQAERLEREIARRQAAQERGAREVDKPQRENPWDLAAENLMVVDGTFHNLTVIARDIILSSPDQVQQVIEGKRSLDFNREVINKNFSRRGKSAEYINYYSPYITAKDREEIDANWRNKALLIDKMDTFLKDFLSPQNHALLRRKLKEWRKMPGAIPGVVKRFSEFKGFIVTDYTLDKDWDDILWVLKHEAVHHRIRMLEPEQMKVLLAGYGEVINIEFSRQVLLESFAGSSYGVEVQSDVDGVMRVLRDASQGGTTETYNPKFTEEFWVQFSYPSLEQGKASRFQNAVRQVAVYSPGLSNAIELRDRLLPEANKIAETAFGALQKYADQLPSKRSELRNVEDWIDHSQIFVMSGGDALILAGYHQTEEDGRNRIRAARLFLPEPGESAPEVVIHLEHVPMGTHWLFEAIHKQDRLLERYQFRGTTDIEALTSLYKGSLHFQNQWGTSDTKIKLENGIRVQALDSYSQGLFDEIVDLRNEGYKVTISFEEMAPDDWAFLQVSQVYKEFGISRYVLGDNQQELPSMMYAYDVYRQNSSRQRDIAHEAPRINQMIAQEKPNAIHLITRGLEHDIIANEIRVGTANRKQLVRTIPGSVGEFYSLHRELIDLRKARSVAAEEETQRRLQLITYFVLERILHKGEVDPLKYTPSLKRAMSQLSTQDIARVVQSLRDPHAPITLDQESRTYEVYYRLKENFSAIFSADLSQLIEAAIARKHGSAYEPYSTEILALSELRNVDSKETIPLPAIYEQNANMPGLVMFNQSDLVSEKGELKDVYFDAIWQAQSMKVTVGVYSGDQEFDEGIIALQSLGVRLVRGGFTQALEQLGDGIEGAKVLASTDPMELLRYKDILPKDTYGVLISGERGGHEALIFTIRDDKERFATSEGYHDVRDSFSFVIDAHLNDQAVAISA